MTAVCVSVCVIAFKTPICAQSRITALTIILILL